MRTKEPAAPRCIYDICDGTGFVVDEDKRTAQACRCRAVQISRTRAKALSVAIPAKYRGVSFDRAPVTQMRTNQVRAVKAYVNSITDKLAKGEGIWFQGDIGTGKTTLAMLVSKSALEAGHSVAIYSLPKLLAQLRATYNDDASISLVDLIDRLCTVELLHIDDVGAENTSPWVLEQLYTIVNTRYEEERAMVVTTNLDYADLKEQIGERTASRLVGICGDPVPMFGPDSRKEFQTPDLSTLPRATPPEPAEPAYGGFEPQEDSSWGAPSIPGYGDDAFRIRAPRRGQG